MFLTAGPTGLARLRSEPVSFVRGDGGVWFTYPSADSDVADDPLKHLWITFVCDRLYVL